MDNYRDDMHKINIDFEYIGFMYKGKAYRNMVDLLSNYRFWNKSYTFADDFISSNTVNSISGDLMDENGIVNVDEFVDYVKDAKFVLDLDIIEAHEPMGGFYSTELDRAFVRKLKNSGRSMQVGDQEFYAANSIDEIIRVGGLDLTEEDIQKRIEKDGDIEMAIKEAINNE